MTPKEASQWGKEKSANLAATNPTLRQLVKRFNLRLDIEAIIKQNT